MIQKNLLRSAAIAVLMMSQGMANGQGLAVNMTGTAANSSAIMDVSSTTQGVLIPRMTQAQRTAIASGAPATGLLVYQTDFTTGFYFYNGSSWVSLNAPGGTAGGDLAGSYPNPTIAATSAAGSDVVGAINASSATINAANLPTTVTTQGNTFNGASQLVQLNGSSQLPVSSGANLTNLSASNLSAGTVPLARLGASGTPSAATFLNGANAWATVSSGTSLLNGTAAGQIYVTNSSPFAVNTTPVSVTGNASLNSSGVLSITSLPAISGASLTSLTPGNLTSGGTLPAEDGSALTALTATNLSSGTVPVARLGSSGTPSSTTFLNGSNAWAAPFALTTSGSGAASFSSGTLNIPTPSSSGSGGYIWNSLLAEPMVSNASPLYSGLTSNTAVTIVPYPFTTTGLQNVTVASVNCTIDAFVMAGYCRATGGANTFSATIVNGTQGTSAVASASLSTSGAAIGAVATAISTVSLSVNAGDILYIQWTNSNTSSSAAFEVCWSVHAH